MFVFCSLTVQNYGRFISVRYTVCITCDIQWSIKYFFFYAGIQLYSIPFWRILIIFNYFKNNEIYTPYWVALTGGFYILCNVYHLQYVCRENQTFPLYNDLWRQNRLRSTLMILLCDKHNEFHINLKVVLKQSFCRGFKTFINSYHPYIYKIKQNSSVSLLLS